MTLKTSFFWTNFKIHRAGCTLFKQHLKIVSESRQSVCEYAKALKTSIAQDVSGDAVYADFSGQWECEGNQVTETSYNAHLQRDCPHDSHKHASSREIALLNATLLEFIPEEVDMLVRNILELPFLVKQNRPRLV